MVEQIARALREELFAQFHVLLATPEEGDRQELDVRQRDQEVRAEEDIQFGGVESLDALVVEREVEDDEDVGLVLVDLRPLALREDVLHVQLVKAEALGEKRGFERARLVYVDPGEAVTCKLGDARLDALDDVARGSAGASTPDAGRVGRHSHSLSRRERSPA